MVENAVKKSKAPWVEALRISPDNKKLAAGAHGGLAWIDIATIGADLSLKKDHPKPISIGSTAVTAIDWDTTGDTIAVTCGEPSFMQVGANKKTSAGPVKDLQWCDWTCKEGWGTQEMQEHKSVGRSRSSKYVAAGDENEIALYRWPVSVENAACKTYYGHSSFVTKVRFMANDKYLVSAGGNDQSVMVWETDFATGGAEEGGAFAEEEDASGDQSAPPMNQDDMDMIAEVDKTD
jgi:WD40 repeat protein